jgi:flagellar basal body-associated protein FliL
VVEDEDVDGVVLEAVKDEDGLDELNDELLLVLLLLLMFVLLVLFVVEFALLFSEAEPENEPLPLVDALLLEVEPEPYVELLDVLLCG